MTKKSIAISVVMAIIVGLGTAITNVCDDLQDMATEDRLNNLEKEVARLSQCEPED